MSLDVVIKTCQILGDSAEALAALGAYLQIRRPESHGDPSIRALLEDVLRAVKPELLQNELSAAEEAAALALIQVTFRQAADLLNNPARRPGWSYEDETILQMQGQVSRLIISAILAAATERPSLGAILEDGAHFLDVGTGVGLLAIEAAKAWPDMHVVGIDPWQPTLSLAEKNVRLSGLSDRIELRLQKIEDFQDQNAFELAWLPGPFLSAPSLPKALRHIKRALIPGGWVVFGVLPAAPTELGRALTALRVVRNGGHPWTEAEAERRLREAGFEEVETAVSDLPVLLALGKRNASDE
jgi:SAM-dependent methyltransferase